MSTAEPLTKEQIRSAATQRKVDRLDYVRQMLRELRDMTEGEEEQFLTHLIGMAYVATSDVIRERYANVVHDVHLIEGVGKGPIFLGR